MDSQINELEAEVESMLRDWETGRATSPSPRDYVLAAIDIYVPDRWPPEDLIDIIADCVDERLMRDEPETCGWVARIVRDELHKVIPIN